MVGPACTQFQEKPSCTSWVSGSLFFPGTVYKVGDQSKQCHLSAESPQKEASGKSVLRHTNEEEDPFDSMDDYEDLRLKNDSL